ncbi:hypothetical protein CEXT_553521 [Caerostris extrusa]|uniref:Uncharacterized protein n=1 Tax=Caerostris extrusa TaxID=172846 RepID=A0AAV4VAG5_CAEEX|nr:hypothetical protein CEXT_553521 [Caerostris extrusa]
MGYVVMTTLKQPPLERGDQFRVYQTMTSSAQKSYNQKTTNPITLFFTFSGKTFEGRAAKHAFRPIRTGRREKERNSGKLTEVIPLESSDASARKGSKETTRWKGGKGRNDSKQVFLMRNNSGDRFIQCSWRGFSCSRIRWVA